jgi:hypothetical protein
LFIDGALTASFDETRALLIALVWLAVRREVEGPRHDTPPVPHLDRPVQRRERGVTR